MKITNKEIIQSYLVTTAKYDFSIYEKRILYRLVENIQFELEGKQLDTSFQAKNLFGDRQIKILTRNLLNGEEDQNYSRIKTALRDLRKKTIEVTEDRAWKLIGIIEKPKLDEKGSSYVEFEIQKEIYEALLNFAKGYRKYELVTAMNFESIYAMRFYELFSNTRTKQTFTIDWLKERFGLKDKYKSRPADFVNFVIKKAKKELDAKSPYSFNFKPVKEGRKISKIDFWPIEISKNKDTGLDERNLQKQVSPRWDLDTATLDQLIHGLGFTLVEIQRNIKLFKEAAEVMDLPHFLALKKATGRGKRNPKGWVITALKNELKLSLRK